MKTEPHLVEPSEEYRDAFFRALDDLQRTEGSIGRREYEAARKGFSHYVQKLTDAAAGRNLQRGSVRRSHYWLIYESEIVGFVRLRHSLPPKWGKFSGHIGYNVPPSQRKKGYGTLLLKLVLERARTHLLSRVLVTCVEGNLPLKKIIERNGGKFEDRMFEPATGNYKLRYWIET